MSPCLSCQSYHDEIISLRLFFSDWCTKVMCRFDKYDERLDHLDSEESNKLSNFSPDRLSPTKRHKQPGKVSSTFDWIVCETRENIDNAISQAGFNPVGIHPLEKNCFVDKDLSPSNSNHEACTEVAQSTNFNSEMSPIVEQGIQLEPIYTDDRLALASGKKRRMHHDLVFEGSQEGVIASEGSLDFYDNSLVFESDYSSVKRSLKEFGNEIDVGVKADCSQNDENNDGTREFVKNANVCVDEGDASSQQLVDDHYSDFVDNCGELGVSKKIKCELEHEISSDIALDENPHIGSELTGTFMSGKHSIAKHSQGLDLVAKSSCDLLESPDNCSGQRSYLERNDPNETAAGAYNDQQQGGSASISFMQHLFNLGGLGTRGFSQPSESEKCLGAHLSEDANSTTWVDPSGLDEMFSRGTPNFTSCFAQSAHPSHAESTAHTSSAVCDVVEEHHDRASMQHSRKQLHKRKIRSHSAINSGEDRKDMIEIFKISATEYQCSDCGEIFPTSRSCNSHMRDHTGIGKRKHYLKCRVCFRQFTRLKCRIHHERTCGKATSTNQNGLLDGRGLLSPPDFLGLGPPFQDDNMDPSPAIGILRISKNAYRCGSCHNIYPAFKTCNRHIMNVHFRNFKCYRCQKKFPSYYQRLKHSSSGECSGGVVAVGVSRTPVDSELDECTPDDGLDESCTPDDGLEECSPDDESEEYANDGLLEESGEDNQVRHASPSVSSINKRESTTLGCE